MTWRKIRLHLRATELRVYAIFKAWHYYNLAAGLDFCHVCPSCTRGFDPIDHRACPRCRILKNKGGAGQRRRLIYRWLVWRMR